MTNVVYCDPTVTPARLSRQANALAERLEQGARALAALAASLTDAQWQIRIPHDGRKVVIVVHHVASMYPIEIQVAQAIAEGKPVTGLTWGVVDTINAKHASENESVTRQAALELLQRNSAEAATAVRALSDEQLAQAVPVSLYGDAPLTCQFFIEDHAMRHSYHHLAKIQSALEAQKG
jgi:hypothetical protein